MSAIGILLILAMAATLTVLIVGIAGFLQGGEFNKRYGNKLMQARVGFQFVAVVLLAILFMTQS